MTWSDVANRIKFFGPDTDDLGNPTGLDGMPITINGEEPYRLPFSTLTDKADILNALQDFYDHSESVRTLLDAGTAGEDIWLMKSTNGSVSRPGTGTAAIDLGEARSLFWMGSNGRFQLEKLGGNVIHELIHALDGYPDLRDPDTGDILLRNDVRDYNNPKFDFQGQTVRLQNQIFHEMGLGEGYSQVGYDATILIAQDVLRKDISYTEDQSIDIAYFDNQLNKTPDVLDLSMRTDSSNDLIIGLDGDDHIYGGAGRDYLYGGVGDDFIYGVT